jgi:hypothetical protein
VVGHVVAHNILGNALEVYGERCLKPKINPFVAKFTTSMAASIGQVSFN